MQLFLTQFLIKCLFVIGLVVTFIQCSSDDPSREAATEAALENPNPPAPPVDPNAPKSPQRPPVVGEMPLAISSSTTAKGSEACLSITASQFKEIVSMQYTMTFDPKVLKFKQVKNFGLPGLTATNFGDRAADKGILAYSWFDANVQGITMTDGKKLYDVCFEAIGEPGSSSSVEFADRPVVIEISNVNSQFLGINGTNGKVQVE